MEFLFYLMVLLITVTIVTGLIHAWVYPYVKLTSEQLPEVVSREMHHYQFGMKFSPKKFQKVRYRYRIEGSICEEVFLLTINLTPDQDVANVSLRSVGSEHRFNAIQRVVNSKLPQWVAQSINPFLDDEDPKMESAVAFSGVIGDQGAFQILVPTEKFQYRFDLTDSGKLVQISKKNLHH